MLEQRSLTVERPTGPQSWRPTGAELERLRRDVHLVVVEDARRSGDVLRREVFRRFLALVG